MGTRVLGDRSAMQGLSRRSLALECRASPLNDGAGVTGGAHWPVDGSPSNTSMLVNACHPAMRWLQLDGTLHQ